MKKILNLTYILILLTSAPLTILPVAGVIPHPQSVVALSVENKIKLGFQNILLDQDKSALILHKIYIVYFSIPVYLPSPGILAGSCLP